MWYIIAVFGYHASQLYRLITRKWIAQLMATFDGNFALGAGGGGELSIMHCRGKTGFERQPSTVLPSQR